MRRMIPDNEWKKQVEDLQALLNGYTSDNASTKKMYWHTIYFKRQQTGVRYFEGYMIILNNDPNLIVSSSFENILKTQGFYGVVINGLRGESDGTLGESPVQLCAIRYKSATDFYAIYRNSSSVLTEETISLAYFIVSDVGVNPIN